MKLHTVGCVMRLVKSLSWRGAGGTEKVGQLRVKKEWAVVFEVDCVCGLVRQRTNLYHNSGTVQLVVVRLVH